MMRTMNPCVGTLIAIAKYVNPTENTAQKNAIKSLLNGITLTFIGERYEIAF
jgi:hypothetical protein